VLLAHGLDRLHNVPDCDAMFRLEQHEMGIPVGSQLRAGLSLEATTHGDLHHVDGRLADKHGCHSCSDWLFNHMPVPFKEKNHIGRRATFRDCVRRVIVHQDHNFAEQRTLTGFQSPGERYVDGVNRRKRLEWTSQTRLQKHVCLEDRRALDDLVNLAVDLLNAEQILSDQVRQDVFLQFRGCGKPWWLCSVAKEGVAG
jgi:hypothetical protein